MKIQEVFNNDLERMNREFERLGAIVRDDDFTSIDPTLAPPILVSAYAALLQFGYANGLIAK